MGKHDTAFGINLNTRAPLLYPEQFSSQRLLELAARAEELGYNSVWVGDNFLAKARLEAVTTLAAISAVTRRVRLGTASLIGPLRHTVWLAITWATLDQLAGGRTILSLCVGGGSAEHGGPGYTAQFDVAGVSYRERGTRLAEQVTLLRRLWTESEVTFRGRQHHLTQVTAAPRPYQRPCPPIWIANNPQVFDLSASVRERMMRRVGRLADGWMTCTATAGEFRQNWQQVQAFAHEAGRDTDRIVPAYQMTLNINPNPQRARSEALDFLNAYYGTSYGTVEEGSWHRDPFGSPQECVDKISALQEAGARTFILRFASPDQETQLQRFTEEVRPAILP
ncbi:MAG: LLM class flavin-dependent oxidoreductase [Acidobacteria bacterium]|nr:LLM class flavin-dependent oxidoreductase [Acidobacteriota bacterium]